MIDTPEIARIRAALAAYEAAGYYAQCDELQDSCSTNSIRRVIAHIDAQAAEIARLRADADQMLETLTGIRNANPREWGELSCEFTEFERWAKARAKHSLLKNAAMGQKS